MVREIEVGSKRNRQKERRGTGLNRKVEIVGERGAELSPKQKDIALLQELDTPSYCGRSDLRQFKEHAPVAWLAIGAMDRCVEGNRVPLTGWTGSVYIGLCHVQVLVSS